MWYFNNKWLTLSCASHLNYHIYNIHHLWDGATTGLDVSLAEADKSIVLENLISKWFLKKLSSLYKEQLISVQEIILG
jgi:hypothetical protein